MRFINREKELEILEREQKKKQSSFVVIHGRRTDKTTNYLLVFIILR